MFPLSLTLSLKGEGTDRAVYSSKSTRGIRTISKAAPCYG